MSHAAAPPVLHRPGPGLHFFDAVDAKTVDFAYNAEGQTTAIDRYAGSTPAEVAESTYNYDALGRLTELTQENTATSTTYADYTWTYDADNEATSFQNAEYSNESIASYAYDSTGQLIAATATGESENAANTLANAYNATGDATSITVGTGSASTTTVGPGNMVESDGTYDYTYDANGNLIEQANDSTRISYSYDNRNRLTLVSTSEYLPALGGGDSWQLVTTVAYTYDMFDNLIGRTVQTHGTGGSDYLGVSTQRYVFDGTNMVLAFDGDDNLTDRILSGPAVDQVLADETFSLSGTDQLPPCPGTTLWALGDNQNTVRDVVEDGGSLEQHTAYSPFGQQVAISTTVSATAADFLFGYTGTYTDPVTGLQLHGVRWYDPSSQRWLTQDPAAADENLYRYCGNGPTDGTDPSGMAEMRAGPPPTWWDKVHDFVIAPSGGNAQDFGLNPVQHTILNIGRELSPDTGTLAPVTRPVLSGLNRAGGEGWGAANMLGGVVSSGYHGTRYLLSDRIEAPHWRRLACENLGVSLKGLDTMRWGLDPRTTGWRDPYPVNASFWDPAKADLYNAPEGSINNFQRYGLPGLATTLELGSQTAGQTIGLKLLGTTAKATIPVLRYTGVGSANGVVKDFVSVPRTAPSSATTLSKLGDLAPQGGSYIKSEIVNGLRGTTSQADRIATGIANGDIRVNVLGDSLMDRYFGTSPCYARGNQVYLRASSSNFLSESVHEGTHALDYVNGFGSSPLKTVTQWENRAWFYERQYQLWTGGNVDFPNIQDMLNHVRSYLNAIQLFNPY